MNSQSKQTLYLILAFVSIPALGLLYVLIFENPIPPAHTGAEGYASHCANCHGAEGEGLRKLYPPLAGSDYLDNHQEDLPCMIYAGMSGPIEVNGQPFDQPMPGLPKLSTGEITRIINHVNSSWGNDLPLHSEEDVEKALKKCPQKKTRTQPRR